MLAEQRAERILKELAQRRAATVTDLCLVTGASEATIRRDLNALAKQGKLSKVHGGAMLMDGEFHSEELDMETKRGLFTQEKDQAGLLRDMSRLAVVDHIITNHEYATVLENHAHYMLGRNLQSISYLDGVGGRNYRDVDVSLGIMNQVNQNAELLLLFAAIMDDELVVGEE